MSLSRTESARVLGWTKAPAACWSLEFGSAVPYAITSVARADIRRPCLLRQFHPLPSAERTISKLKVSPSPRHNQRVMESLAKFRLAGPGYGAFVLSLDFELHWGVRDHEPLNGPYRPNLLGAREAIPRLLEMFKRYEISGTWAIVGFLFAESR